MGGVAVQFCFRGALQRGGGGWTLIGDAGFVLFAPKQLEEVGALGDCDHLADCVH